MQVPDEDLPDLDPNFDFDKTLIALGVAQASMTTLTSRETGPALDVCVDGNTPLNAPFFGALGQGQENQCRKTASPDEIDTIYSENAGSPSSAPSLSANLSPVLPSYSPSSVPSGPPTEASSPSAPLAASSAMSQDDSRSSCDINANIAPMMSESTGVVVDALQPKRKVIRRQYGSACDFCHKLRRRDPVCDATSSQSGNQRRTTFANAHGRLRRKDDRSGSGMGMAVVFAVEQLFPLHLQWVFVVIGLTRLPQDLHDWYLSLFVPPTTNQRSTEHRSEDYIRPSVGTTAKTPTLNRPPSHPPATAPVDTTVVDSESEGNNTFILAADVTRDRAT
ncbi:hypothetical protein CERSUDRAFT_124173 [Gelatoporia subvermispora B]|uniref:Uncharacterized protein n=1 Tax=Ceriporiopsis subvermispora (strain B) TaxID=914234 RepID=M2QGL3_CERS8|nr:hypothetical protein CERSUDRAFT_124173 [Gelatoporia subvermispora B]